MKIYTLQFQDTYNDRVIASASRKVLTALCKNIDADTKDIQEVELFEGNVAPLIEVVCDIGSYDEPYYDLDAPWSEWTHDFQYRTFFVENPQASVTVEEKKNTTFVTIYAKSFEKAEESIVKEINKIRTKWLRKYGKENPVEACECCGKEL